MYVDAILSVFLGKPLIVRYKIVRMQVCIHNEFDVCTVQVQFFYWPIMYKNCQALSLSLSLREEELTLKSKSHTTPPSILFLRIGIIISSLTSFHSESIGLSRVTTYLPCQYLGHSDFFS